MARNPAHQRRSVRLRAYDYAAPGAYFVTICTRQRRLFFDEPEMLQIAATRWRQIPAHATNAELDQRVVMPNHFHGIIVIVGGNDTIGRRGVQLNAPTTNDITLKPAASNERPRDAGNPFSAMSPRRNTLAVFVRTYKAAVTTVCRAARRSEIAWQRGYFEHVIRNRRELDAIRRYIRDNPLKWALDRDNPANMGRLPAPVNMDEYLADLGL